MVDYGQLDGKAKVSTTWQLELAGIADPDAGEHLITVAY